ncbi:MAG: Hsp20/alpha crystallin family protein [Candidatus Sericytochromatia bacterium]|nr:Hsp20/alpha crystallin family protein [Candidatus Sericytochromatia bacterium]
MRPRFGTKVSPLLLQLLEELGQGLDQAGGRRPSTESRDPDTWVPAMDILEQAEGYVLMLDVPGMRLDDIVLNLEGRHLVVGGERMQLEPEGSKALTAERPHGRFRKQVPLPPDVEAESIRASLKDGVLTVWLPRAASAAPRTIPIDPA